MLRIMIIDDNPNFRKFLAEILAASFPANIRTGAFHDREQFLTSISASEPDLLFLDIQSFGPACGELTRKIKSEHPDIRVILLTSFDQQEYYEFAYASGADDCVLKNDCTPDQIIGIVEFIMDDAGSPACSPMGSFLKNRLFPSGK